MGEFTKQDWATINDLITLAWQCGAVKSHQMGQGLEQLRAKILAKLDPPATPIEDVKK